MHLNINSYYKHKKSQFEVLTFAHDSILFLGDSLTDEGEWVELLGNTNIVNRGISGDTTRRILNRLDAVVDTKPKQIFLMVGINDFVNEKKNIKSMEDFIRHFYNEVKICLNGYTIKPYCVYGDSVTPDTPLMIKTNGQIEIKTIDSLNNEWKNYDQFKAIDSNRKNKEQNLKDLSYKVWTNKGWAKIKRVIRHKCKKKIYRISTPTSVIDVTEDHSLLDKNIKIIKIEQPLAADGTTSY